MARVRLVSAALLETVGVGVHLQDVDVVGDAIEQCAGEALGAEDLGPFVKGQIACDQRRRTLIALTDVSICASGCRASADGGGKDRTERRPCFGE